MQKEVIWDYSFLLYKLKVIYFSVFAASCLQVYNPFSQQMYAYDNKKMCNVISVIGILLMVVSSVYLWRMGVFSSQGKLRRFIAGFGMTGGLVFVFIQIVQTVIPHYFRRNQLFGRYYLFSVEMGFAYNYV